jgi:hypothetical protein
MRIFMVIIGVVAILLGGLWTAQGLDLMGQTGGMNGVKIWAVIGPIVAVVGLIVLIAGVRRRSKTTA